MKLPGGFLLSVSHHANEAAGSMLSSRCDDFSLCALPFYFIITSVWLITILKEGEPDENHFAH
ncbi:hypothetical protein WBG83_00085 [Paenibacillus sp. y28]